MPTNNKMPQLDIIFKGLGVSAVARGARGVAVLILIDDTEDGGKFARYKSIADFGSDEQKKYTKDNVAVIKDALEGTPLELYVFRMATEGNLSDVLKFVGGKVPRNCWIGINSTTTQHHDDLVSWVKSEVKNNKKRYKALVYKGTTTDDMHIVNFTNSKITFADSRGETTGDKAIPYLLGFLAGLPLNMSAIAKPLTKFTDVAEVEELGEELDKPISNGEFVLFNDEGIVKVARGVNSLVTLGQDVTLEMTHVNVVEKMDLIYTDIFTAWNDNFKGKYPNILSNQMLLISAINGYFKTIARDFLLDPEFDNRALIDIEAQRIANYTKYGEDEANSWDDNKVMKMTYSTNVYLKANIKIAGIMEDFLFNIFM